MTLEIKNLNKNYGQKHALVDINMTLTAGVYGLLGPNGAGKSTLMNIITDNLAADSGVITYDGKDILKMGADFRRILGYMPQQQGLYGTFTAKRFLYYIAALKGLKKADAKEQINRSLQLVNLQDEAGKRLSAFSGGMKQRILIAQAILGDPKVLILDEPTAGLDPKERIRIRNLISSIALDKIVILATHVVSDIEFISKEVILLKSGKLLAKAEPSEILKELDGKVFELEIPEERLSEITSSYKVGNISKAKNGIVVRIVSDIRPEFLTCSLVSPTLEDAYLYLFDDDEKETVLSEAVK